MERGKPECVCAVFLMFLLISCSAQKEAKNVPVEAAKAIAVIDKPVAMEWEEEWNKVILGAKKENRIVVYATLGGDTRAAVIKSFNDKYGIVVDYIVGRGGEISQKVITERRAGLFLADVYVGGATTLVNEIKPSGALDPLLPALILPEVKEGKNWWGGQLPWVDKEQRILTFLAYPSIELSSNTELVKEGEVKSVKDMLNPKWNGKILMNDPTIAGAGLGFFARNFERYGIDFMKKLAEMRPGIIRDQRLQVEWLAQGRYALTTSAQSEVMAGFIKAGAPIKDLELIEGGLSSGSGHITLINRALHPDAARVFINWLLSREVQTMVSRSVLQQSAREDVPVDHLDRVRKPGVGYIEDSSEERLLRRPADAKLAQEIFGPLMK